MSPNKYAIFVAIAVMMFAGSMHVASATSLTANAPTPTNPGIDSGQSVTLTATPSGGSGTYTITWLLGQPSGGTTCNDADVVGSGTTYVEPASSVVSSSTYISYNVSDSTGNSICSNGYSTITTYAALNNPNTPSTTGSAYQGQAAATETFPSSLGGAPSITYTWLVSSSSSGPFTAATSTDCATPSGTATGGGSVNCVIGTSTPTGTYYYKMQLEDSSAGGAETTNSTASNAVSVSQIALTAGAPTPSNPTLYTGQSVTLTANVYGGDLDYIAYQWYTAPSAGTCSSGADTPISGATSSTYVATPSSSTYYCYYVEDNTAASTYSNTDYVTVDFLTAPSTPTVSVTSMSVGNTLTVSSTLPDTGEPPYSWTWEVSVNGGSLVDTTQCSVNSGTGASANTIETCQIVGNTLTEGDTYAFALQLQDSVPSTMQSSSSPTVTVQGLTPGAITPSSPVIDSGQSVTLTAHPSGGTPSYTYQWYTAASSGTCSSSDVAISSATSNTYSASPTSDTYYCYTIKNSYSGSNSFGSPTDEVAVNGLPSAGSITPSSPVIDSGQSVTLTAHPSGGTPSYTYQWYGGTSNTCSSDTLISSATSNTYSASPTSDTYYCYEVTDSVSESSYSPTDQVTANPSLITPSTLTRTNWIVDQGQTAVTDTLPGTLGGTGTVTYTWYFSQDGGSTWSPTYPNGGYPQCASSSSSGTAIAGNTVSCVTTGSTWVGENLEFELRLTDSAPFPATTSSPASPVVTVNPAVVANAPTPSAPTIDSGQSITLAANPHGGYNGYSGYQWYTAPTSGTCSSSDTAISGATDSTYSASPTSNTYYCYSVTDTLGETAYSSTNFVTVGPALSTANAPTSVTHVTVGQTAATDTLPSSLSGVFPMEYAWFVSYNGGSYSAATTSQCAVPSGTAANSLAVSCMTPANALAGTYAYEMQLKDSSAGNPDYTISSNSGSATVNPVLTANAPTPFSAITDACNGPFNIFCGEMSIPRPTFTAHAIGGSGTYAYQWYSAATAGTCPASDSSIPSANTITYTPYSDNVKIAPGAYYYCYSVNDGTSTAYSSTAKLTVNPDLSIPSISLSVNTIDAGQSVTITAQWTGGTPNYYVSYGTNNAGCTSYATVSFLNGVTNSPITFTASPTSNTIYWTNVQDAAGEYEYSPCKTLTVNPALATASVPTAVASVDAGQTAANAILPSSIGGTAPVTYTWLVSYNGISSYTPATTSQCATPSGIAFAGNTVSCITPANIALGTYAYEMQLKDSAGVPENTISSNSLTVTVSPSLNTATIPTAVASVDAGQTAANVILPSTIGGTPPVTYTWLVSYNGGSYAPATTSQCITPFGIATNSLAVSCIMPANALTGTYAYEIQHKDSATSAVTTLSSSSPPANVTLALSSPKITSMNASYTLINDDHKFVVSAAAATGGTPPYTYAWSGNTVACPGFTNPGNVLSFTYTPSSGTNGCIFTLKVSDSASTPATQSLTSNLIVAAPPDAHMFAITNTTEGNVINDTTEGLRFLLPANSTGRLNGSDTFFIVINDSSNTTAGPANFNKLYSANVVSSPATVNSISVIADYPCSISSSNIYPYELANGTWTAITPFSVNASSCTVAFSISADPIIGLMQYVPPASNNNGGGTGVSSNGAGTPEGSSGPTVVPFKTSNETGYNIYNISNDNSEHLLVDGAAYLLTQNFITPNTTGITIDNVSYLLKVGETLALLGKANVFIHLVALSYIPVLHTVNYTLFAVPGNSTPVNTTSTTTTTVATTTTIKAAPPASSTVATTTIPATVPPVSGHQNLQGIYYVVVAAIIVAVIIVGVRLASRSGGYKKAGHQGRSK